VVHGPVRVARQYYSEYLALVTSPENDKIDRAFSTVVEAVGARSYGCAAREGNGCDSA